MSPRIGRLVLVAVAIAAGGMSLYAMQQPPAPMQSRPPVFRGTSELVEIDAVVTDPSGAIVRGLTRDDFQVAEDGAPQDLVQFSFVDMPVPPPGAKPDGSAMQADVATNAKPSDSRQYVIVLDGFHVDSTRSTVVRKLARQFVEGTMGPHDVASLIVLGRNAANQQFTSNKALLVSALDQFVGQKSQSATYNITQDAMLRPQTGVAPEDAESGARATEGRIMLESLRQLCQSLGATQGIRRSIVLFSEGLDFDTSDLIGQDQRPAAGGQGLMHEPAKHASLLLEAEQELFVAARRANVAIYTVDPRGPTMGEDVGIQISSAAPGTDILRETQRGQGTLRTFAEQTGGLAVVGTNNIGAGFAQIARANSSYYVLGYSPSNAARDGTYRKISVTVKPPHLEVTARKGYYVPVEAKPSPAAPASTPGPNAASPRMRELLASALPIAGLGLRVTGGPVRSQNGKVLIALVVEIDTKDLPFAERGGLLSNDIEMAFIAMDAQGKLQAANRSVGNLRLPPAARASATNGLRYVVEFPASPGRYQVRVAAHESEGGAGGSALFDVDATDMSKAPLSIGTILLSSTAADAMPTTGSYPVVKSLVTLPPTAAREFSRGDTVVAFADLTDAIGGKPHDVEIATSVQGSDGADAFHAVTTKSSRDLSEGSGGYGLLSRVPLSAFAPGRYVLTIEAKTAAGKTASKSIVFTVR